MVLEAGVTTKRSPIYSVRVQGYFADCHHWSATLSETREPSGLLQRRKYLDLPGKRAAQLSAADRGR